MRPALAIVTLSAAFLGGISAALAVRPVVIETRPFAMVRPQSATTPAELFAIPAAFDCPDCDHDSGETCAKRPRAEGNQPPRNFGAASKGVVTWEYG